MTHLKVPALPHRFPIASLGSPSPRCSWSSLAWTIQRTRPRGKRRAGTSARRIWATWWCIGRTWRRSHSFCAMAAMVRSSSMDHHGSMVFGCGWLGEGEHMHPKVSNSVVHFHHWNTIENGHHIEDDDFTMDFTWPHMEKSPWKSMVRHRDGQKLDSGIFRIRWPRAWVNVCFLWLSIYIFPRNHG